ncbi:MAG: hypothetical protein FRX48_09122 [Lasallia pustulata]|uniref:GYF domain-containing protein n=1 Tax=Lasallia pustulata TaxID=136370 RepID=A0A5M8PDJ3_9LECA|nr:MAG: hypothetical protein FRX48_09122 [Lasallia pustulata]
MPSSFASSFASAAAGNGAYDGSSSNRASARADGSGDWSRARTNGATQTFRRPPVAPTLSHTREASQNFSSNSNIASPGVYVPPHLNTTHQSSLGRNGPIAESRYSKDQLLDLFRAQADSATSIKNLSDFFVGGWNPGEASTNSNGVWSKKDDHKDSAAGPEVCWDHEGKVIPLAMIDITEEERELFSSSVNSPLKPPPQNASKENTTTNGISGRKTSISQVHGSSNVYGSTTPSNRPGNRRRDTGDSSPSSNPLASPASGNRFPKDEAPAATSTPSLLRRRTDLNESNPGSIINDNENGKQENVSNTALPFAPLKRSTTGPFSAGLSGPSSPWSAAPPSAGFSPMGAFGNFSLGGSSGHPTTPGEKRSVFGSLRGESRFKGLMNTESPDDVASIIKEKASVSSLERLAESDIEAIQSNWGAARSARPLSTESNPYGNEQSGTGSAALGGDDPSPPQHASRVRNLGRDSFDDTGFSAFGMSSDLPPFREMMHRQEVSQQLTPQSKQRGQYGTQEPMSPTNTNPYQSPEGDNAARDDGGSDGSDIQTTQYSAIGAFGHPSRAVQSAFEGTASDRSQTSSVGPSRALPNLGALSGFGGLGGSGPWSAAPGAIGTPSRATPGYSSGFGDSLFGPLGDLQSPVHAGTGGSGFFGSVGPSGAGTIGRGSKMGSLFPTAMQEQMQGGDRLKPEQSSGEATDTHQFNAGRAPAGANAPGFGAPGRDTESPFRPGRGMVDDLFGNLEPRNRGSQGINSPFGASDAGGIFGQPATSTAAQTPFSTASTLVGTPGLATPGVGFLFGRMPDQDSSVSSQMPATQQRQMVMPDRMRWIYRDPQGNTQGPWSGLEMHDWYKAGFFSPELQVKKLEDADYEPLAQLIRRIGNSREPFLVPQIGIPHGSSAAQPSSTATGAVPGAVPAATPSGTQAGAAQPPFASSFPSFGTTLTAEQQNALERRKQEEQYLMARQKEHLAQQQVMIKQMQHMQGGAHGIHSQQLHHQSSGHSLHSQPSYGSITSPSGYQPSPAQGPIQPPASVSGFFDAPPRHIGPGLGPLGPGGSGLEPLGSARDGDMPALMERLNLGRGNHLPFGGPSYDANQQEGLSHSHQVAAMLQDRARLQHEQDQYDALQRGVPEDSQTSTDRLEQYHQLRAPYGDDQKQPPPGGVIGRPTYQQRDENDDQIRQQQQNDFGSAAQQETGPLSLTERVQKAAASSQQSPAVQPESPWAKVEPGLPQPFPQPFQPPQSITPLPAPAAQRNRQHVAEALTAESGSRPQTPSVETPSATVAPWAKELNESSKGPSLREIQVAEARKAAQQEEIAAAARRAIAEQERQNQPQLVTPAPGLPSSSTWARASSPATPTAPGPSAWAKPIAGKSSVPTTAATTKRTLAQIQKEEEARKQRTVAAATVNAAANVSGVPVLASGKRYADLASKVVSTGPQAPGGAWTTVGAGGKLKTPTSATTPSAPSLRAASTGIVPTPGPVVKPRATPVATRSTTLGGALSGQQNATERLQKWAKSALNKGLSSTINVDDFVQQLLQLPAELEIISDSVYAASQTLDGRRFAEEFIRRRKLADRGLVPDTPTGGSNGFSAGTAGENKSGGGWSEVAKKGPASAAKEEPSSAFKVVAAKKKGKR